CTNENKQLQRLKKEYIDYYLSLHQAMRLSATEEKKKSDLLQSQQCNALKLLASNIELLPTDVFDDWKTKVDALRVCYHLTSDKLTHTPECPNCNFSPKEEQLKQGLSLSELEDELEVLLSTWTETLLMNFNDPAVKDSIELLEIEEKQLIDIFIQDQEFTLPIPIKLIDAINKVFKGIHKEQLDIEQLREVFGNGNPITVNEVQQNLDKLLKALVGDNDPDRVRLTIKR